MAGEKRGVLVVRESSWWPLCALSGEGVIYRCGFGMAEWHREIWPEDICNPGLRNTAGRLPRCGAGGQRALGRSNHHTTTCHSRGFEPRRRLAGWNYRVVISIVYILDQILRE